MVLDFIIDIEKYFLFIPTNIFVEILIFFRYTYTIGETPFVWNSRLYRSEKCIAGAYKCVKKLEYRGYDSAGIAVLEEGDILVRKCKGALKFLQEKIANEVIKGSVGIGHTRWATHGEPSDTNSHPHTNMDNTISIVHNGIIENYAELKVKLQEKGIVFQSQTDTEVIVHLIDQFL